MIHLKAVYKKESDRTDTFPFNVPAIQALGQVLLDPAHLSNTITTLRLPAGWSYEALHGALRAEGFVIYAGQGDLREQAFRISNMGVMDRSDYQRLLDALERVMKREAQETSQ